MGARQFVWCSEYSAGDSRRPFRRLHLIAFLSWVCLLLQSSAAGQVKPIRRILILYEAGTSYPGIRLIDEGIRAALDTSPYKFEIYREYMDTELFPDQADQQRFRDFYIRKYQNRRPDVIVAIGPSPLKFMQETHRTAFPGVPIVFWIWTPLSSSLDSDFTGVDNDITPLETIDVAVRLRPGTRHIVVVAGTSFADTQYLEMVKDQLKSYESNFDVSYLTSLTMPDLVDRLKHLPNNTIVLFTGFGQDAAGTKFISGDEASAMVAAAANAPVFSLIDTSLNHGEVGGKVSYFGTQGRIAGELALRVLKGEKPQDIPVARGPNVYMFDWRALRRWGIKESSLPPGSIVLNRQRNFWEFYWRYVVMGLVLFLAQALLIVALLAQRRRRKGFEGSLVWRLEFEKVVSNLSRAFINLAEEEVNPNIEKGLSRIGEFLKMDRITLFEFSSDRTEMAATYTWNTAGVRETPRLVTTNAVPWWQNRVLRGEETYVSQLRDLPEEASAEKNYLYLRGVVSAASIPLQVAGEVSGALVFVSVRRQVFWTEDLTNQLKIIGDIFWNALKRKRTHEALLATQALVREREERFRFVANTAPVTIWMTDRDNNCTYANQHWLDFTGRSLESQLGMGWTEQIHPEDLKPSWEIFEKASARRDSFRSERRIRRHDGAYRWMLASGVPRFNTDGSFAGYIGSAIDITERKLAEEALSTVSQKLIEAQEQERFRIARELHDDINQQLALLAISLESLKKGVPDSAVGLAQRIGETSEQITDVAKDIQALSHRLHSSKLEYLGLAAAAKSFCREFSDQQKVEISFQSESLPKELPREISVCLFRVLQEALQNAAKHSGSRQFEVRLQGGSNGIELAVHDSGLGFDAEEAVKGRGLGLTSMKERLKLVDGELSIDSQLHHGTTIQARVPVNPRAKSVATVG